MTQLGRGALASFAEMQDEGIRLRAAAPLPGTAEDASHVESYLAAHRTRSDGVMKFRSDRLRRDAHPRAGAGSLLPWLRRPGRI